MLYLRDRLMCHVVWPVCRRMPVAMWVGVARVATIPYAFVLLLRQRWLVRGAAQTIGRHTPWGLLAMAMQMAWFRLRYIDYYLYECVPHLQVIWPDDREETERCIYVLVNLRGSETILSWMDRYPSVMIRRQFGSEGETTYATARKGFRWWGHLAEVRDKACRGRIVVVNGSPLQYRSLIEDRRNIVIYQDIWDESETGKGKPTVPFLGHDVPLVLGAMRLSKLCGGLPIRFVRIQPEGKRWVVRISPRLPTENTGPCLVDLMEKEIIPRLGAWEPMDIFLKQFGPISRLTKSSMD